MPGNKLGGLKAAFTNKKRYGDDYYANIGKIGGKKGRTGGFYANRELASKVGAIGGKKSRRPSPLDGRHEEIISMRYKGYSQQQIADVIGCHHTTIFYFFKRLENAGTNE